jgi:hypothetical protein
MVPIKGSTSPFILILCQLIFQGIFDSANVYKFLIRRFTALAAFSLLWVAIVLLMPEDEGPLTI